MDILQQTLMKVQKWCDDRGLRINPKKTVIVPFTKRRIIRETILPNIYGENIQFSSTVKYLGAYLDTKLNWNTHIDKSIDKARNSL